ncbi:hypothetical protein [Mesotoga sp. BH458_6_3_2_1]|uniref:hypothetical protein n=1 Tax=Mesotoga sp. BH458_6_3_2_1 TaxID=1437446 RepID=UPI000EF27849|nr:hypothetical protein [Mesotoga sp. BH458_6_3_2_1]RLL82409.1 hypothetical protein Y697_07610 [Mesotoga sp. BH458_6_3_2_1]
MINLSIDEFFWPFVRLSTDVANIEKNPEKLYMLLVDMIRNSCPMERSKLAILADEIRRLHKESKARKDVKKVAFYEKILGFLDGLRNTGLVYDSLHLTSLDMNEISNDRHNSLKYYHVQWDITNHADVVGNKRLWTQIERAVTNTDKIAVVDRYINLAILDKAWDSKKKNANCFDTLEWLSKNLKVDKASNPNDPMIFIIATFPGTSEDRNKLQELLRDLDKKVVSFRNDFDFPVSILIPTSTFESKEYLHLHERFLITTQVIMKSDGGFGLTNTSETTLLVWNSQRVINLLRHLEELNDGLHGKRTLKVAVFSPDEKKWHLESKLPDSFKELVCTAKNRCYSRQSR